MDTSRRTFLQLLKGSALSAFFLSGSRALAKKSPPPVKDKKSFPDLVAVRGGSPAQMFEVGIEAIGGMTRFVKKKDTVLVKPNIGWDKPPSSGANTNPDLVAKIIEQAYSAGAKKVVVFDHTCNTEKDCYDNSGIAAAVKKSGGELQSAEKERSYREATIADAKILRKLKVHNAYLDADVIINVPILKHHVGSRMTGALKNLMGVVWDRRMYHRDGLHEAIAEFGLFPKKVHLNVIDAYTVMLRNGPRGLSTSDLAVKKMQLLSCDMVLADAAGAKILGQNPVDVTYLTMAEKLGVGTMNIEGSDIKRISIES